MNHCKKYFCVLLTLLSVCGLSFSYEKNEADWSSLTYYNVPIYKVLEAREAYVVVYGKNRVGAGSTVIPKRWAHGTVENPRKLKFRASRDAIQPFMTIVKKDGEFHRVILTLPMSKAHTIWGIARDEKINDVDKETLEELELL